MKKILAIFAFALVAFMAHAQSCPDDNHPHAIDLGLPSGTLWACCNVGADKPEAQGGHYAWGETETKSVYTTVTYLYATGVDEDGDGWYDDYHSDTNDTGVYQNLGNYKGESEEGSIYDIADTQYDVAHVKWGGSWVMPSREQQEELRGNSTCKLTEMNGIYGHLFTGANGGSIFLPAAGYRAGYYRCHAGESGYYWSSTQCPSLASGAYRFNIYFSGGMTLVVCGCYEGNTVRPVISGTNNINFSESASIAPNQAIYNLYGIKVADNAAYMNTLPPGIYIVNGKKFVVK